MAEKSKGLFSADDWQCKTYSLLVYSPAFKSLSNWCEIKHFSLFIINVLKQHRIILIFLINFFNLQKHGGSVSLYI